MENFSKVFILCILIGVLTSCNLDKTDKFYNGRARVEDFSTGKYGFINENEELIIDKKYDWASDFRSGYAVVEVSNTRGVINKSGSIIIPIRYDNIQHLEGNYFKVRENQKYGVFNSENEVIIPIVAQSIGKIYNNKYFEVKLKKEENSICLFNKSGEKLTKAIWTKVIELQGNYVIMYSNSVRKIFDLENKNNPINKLPSYESAHFINSSKTASELLFKVSRIKGPHGDHQTAIIDYQGKTIIPFGRYEYIWGFAENLFSVSVIGAKQGYATKNGNLFAIKPIFDKVGEFKNGVAKVTLHEKTFFIDKYGNCVKDCPSQKWMNYYKISSFKIDISAYKRLLEKGLQESESQNYVEAIHIFTSAIEEYPADYRAFHNRGLSYLMTNNLEEAKEDLDIAVKLNPTNADSYYLSGIIHQRWGNSYAAISDFEKAIELNPYNSDSYLKCAIVYGKLGNKNKACSYIKEACRLGNYEACSGYSRFCR